MSDQLPESNSGDAAPEPIVVDATIDLKHDGKDLQRILGELNPILETVARESAMRRAPLDQVMEADQYSKAHVEASWLKSG